MRPGKLTGASGGSATASICMRHVAGSRSSRRGERKTMPDLACHAEGDAAQSNGAQLLHVQSSGCTAGSKRQRVLVYAGDGAGSRSVLSAVESLRAALPQDAQARPAPAYSTRQPALLSLYVPLRALRPTQNRLCTLKDPHSCDCAGRGLPRALTSRLDECLTERVTTVLCSTQSLNHWTWRAGGNHQGGGAAGRCLGARLRAAGDAGRR